MLADLIRAFCKENNYEVDENYSKSMTTPFGEETITTIGIVVKEDCNPFDVLAQLSSYIEEKGVYNAQLQDELANPGLDDLGSEAVWYFPYIEDYHPLQP